MKRLISIVLLSCAFPVQAEDWYAGVGVGFFDVDRDATHFSSSSANLFVGYDIGAYLGVELQAEYIDTGFDTDDDGFRSEFGGYGISPSLIAKYSPSNSGFDLYVRGGFTYMDYTASDFDTGLKIEDTNFQAMFGVGVRTKYLFAEYVNYDVRHGLFLEQIRGGFRLEF